MVFGETIGTAPRGSVAMRSRAALNSTGGSRRYFGGQARGCTSQATPKARPRIRW